MVKSLDAEVAKSPSLRSFVVVLTDDADKTSAVLTKLAAEHGIKNVPLTLVDTPQGPPAYSIAKDADVTVMMWRGVRVQVNHAFKDGGLTASDIKTIVSELPKITAK